MGIRIAVWLALAAAWPVATAAAFSQDAWQFYKPVTVTEAGVNRLALDDEIFGQARADMADLRIIAAGAEVPYVVAAEAGTAVPVNVSARLTNATFVRGAYSQAVADFGAPIPEVDHVVLGVTGDNFQRRVTVEGSNDAAAWQTVTENGYIYDYTDSRGGVAITDTTVRFTPATFRYYRIRIAADAGEPLPIHSIRSAQLASQPPRARTQERPAIITSEGNRTRLTVDMEQTGIPVTAVAVAATDTNFDRGVLSKRAMTKPPGGIWRAGTCTGIRPTATGPNNWRSICP